jgi:hypothetical protein
MRLDPRVSRDDERNRDRLIRRDRFSDDIQREKDSALLDECLSILQHERIVNPPNGLFAFPTHHLKRPWDYWNFDT